MILTEAMIDQMCGEPTMSFTERLRYDEERLEIQVKWTGGAIE